MAPEGETLITDTDDRIPSDSGIEEPATPVEPSPPASPGERVQTTADQQAQAERLKRDREVARIEKIAKRSLSDDEKKLVLFRFEQNVEGIDQRSREILDRYSNLTKSGNFLEKAKGFLSGFARTVATSGGAFVLRQAIKATPLSFLAGTISGSIIGGVLGGKRSYEAEAAKHFSAGAIIEEYQKLKNDNPRSALAFLQSVLEGRGDKSGVVGERLVDSNLRGPVQWAETKSVRKARRSIEAFINPEQGYRGDLSGLLELITFYREEARETLGSGEGRNIDDLMLANLGKDGRGFRENYRDDVRNACRAAIWGGVKKGALIGAGVGAVSDIIAWFGNSLRSEHAHREYILNQQSPEHTYHTQFQDTPPDWMTDAQQQFYDQGLTRQTDFGNSLAEAMHKSLETGELQMPDNLRGQLDDWIQKGGTKEDFYRQIAEPFRYATPLSKNAFFYQGQNIDFNYGAMQDVLNKTFAGVDMSHLTYPDNFFDTIKNADQIISVEFPEKIAQGAVEAGAQAAANEPLATAVAHGAGIGLGTQARVKSRIEGPENAGGGGIGNGSIESGTGGGGDRGDQDRQGGAAEDEADTGEEEQRGQQQETPPKEPANPDIINWEGYANDLDGLKDMADKVISKLSEGKSTPLSDQDVDLQNAVNLFEFLRQKQKQSQQWEIKLSLGEEAMKLQGAVVGEPQIILTKKRGFKIIDLSKPKETKNLKLTINEK